MLLHPPHDHAEVTRLHHHAHALEHLHKRRGNPVGQTFLELEATRKYIDDLYVTKYIDILTSAS